jgi:hypothetical protein
MKSVRQHKTINTGKLLIKNKQLIERICITAFRRNPKVIAIYNAFKSEFNKTKPH